MYLSHHFNNWITISGIFLGQTVSHSVHKLEGQGISSKDGINELKGYSWCKQLS